MGFDGLAAPGRKSGANNQKITTIIENLQIIKRNLHRHWPDEPNEPHSEKSRDRQSKCVQAEKSIQPSDRATKNAALTSAFEEVERRADKVLAGLDEQQYSTAKERATIRMVKEIAEATKVLSKYHKASVGRARRGIGTKERAPEKRRTNVLSEWSAAA